MARPENKLIAAARRAWGVIRLLLKVAGAGIVAVIVVLVGGILFMGIADWVWDLFRLDGSDTVYDYQTASVEDVVDFLRRVCHDGECIDSLDWECGFTLAGDGVDQTEECFRQAAKKAKSWVKLDSLRKWCGHQYMEFEGERFGHPDHCQEQGGQWGVKSPRPNIDF